MAKKLEAELSVMVDLEKIWDTIDQAVSNIDKELDTLRLRKNFLEEQRASLRRMSNAWHDDEKPKPKRSSPKTEKCEFCGKMFSRQGLASHLKMHKRENNIPVVNRIGPHDPSLRGPVKDDER